MKIIHRIARFLALFAVYTISVYSYLMAKGFVHDGDKFVLSNTANASTSFSTPIDAQLKISSSIMRPVGSENASITMYSYSSFDCSHCENFHRFVYPKLERDFIKTNKVRFVFISFPFSELNMKATKFLYCMPEEKYETYLNQLFKKKNWRYTSNDTLLVKETIEAGLSPEEIEKCNNNKKLTSDILLMRENAIQEIGIRSTPSFIIETKNSKEVIVGLPSYEKIKEYLEAKVQENN